MMTDRERLDKLGQCLQNYMRNEDTGPVPGYSDNFYGGVLWAFGKLVQIYPGEETAADAPQGSAVEEIEKPFITECRNTAIEKNLPLYFVYYEETGVFEVYKTDTKELFEKRHCAKHLSAYEFQEIATHYLDDYSEWSGGAEG